MEEPRGPSRDDPLDPEEGLGGGPPEAVLPSINAGPVGRKDRRRQRFYRLDRAVVGDDMVVIVREPVGNGVRVDESGHDGHGQHDPLPITEERVQPHGRLVA